MHMLPPRFKKIKIKIPSLNVAFSEIRQEINNIRRVRLVKSVVLESIIKLLLLCDSAKARSSLCWIKWIESSIDHFNFAEGFVLARQRQMNHTTACKADIRPLHSPSWRRFPVTYQRNPGFSSFTNGSFCSVGHMRKNKTKNKLMRISTGWLHFEFMVNVHLWKVSEIVDMNVDVGHLRWALQACSAGSRTGWERGTSSGHRINFIRFLFSWLTLGN